MPQPLDFSNKDLRNRSFKGRDLASADFRKADIRGCDFRNANLEGADFSGVTAGQSGKQILIVVDDVGVLAVMGTVFTAGIVVSVYTGMFMGLIAGTSEGEVLVAIASAFTSIVGTFVVEIKVPSLVRFAVAIAVVIAVAIVIANKYASANKYKNASANKNVSVRAFIIEAFLLTGRKETISASAGASVFASGFASVVASAEFGKGNISRGVAYSLIVIFSLFLTDIFLMQAIEEIRSMTGTSFKGATLAKSKFMGAILKNCDFTNARIHQTDWTHSHFTRCKLSGNLDNQSVRELCISRIGANENFSSSNLSGLNLIGVNLRAAILAGANLNSTNLTQADLENANLVNVQAIQTDFTKANLSGACIENWAITSETIFTDAICSHIYLDSDKTERKPASGSFEQGDFEKLVIQFTKTLDFLFRNGIDSQAFDFALNNLIEDYEKMGISLKGVDDLGDGDRLVRFNTVPDAPKAEMHAQFTEEYTAMHQQLEASRNKVWELQQKLDRIDLETHVTQIEK